MDLSRGLGDVYKRQKLNKLKEWNFKSIKKPKI
jgi:hypothetical protein